MSITRRAVGCYGVRWVGHVSRALSDGKTYEWAGHYDDMPSFEQVEADADGPFAWTMRKNGLVPA